jgi:PAXNEB protein
VIRGNEEGRGSLRDPSPWAESDVDAKLLAAHANGSDVLQLLRSLPRNRHYPAKRQPEDGIAAEGTSARPSIDEPNALETLKEEEDERSEGDVEDDDDNEEESRRIEAEANLKIAWQYSKMEQTKRQGSAQHSKGSSSSQVVFCHKYDLSALWTDSDIPTGLPTVPEEAATLRPIDLESTGSRIDTGYALFVQLCDQVQALVVAAPPVRQQVIRLLLYIPHNDPGTLSALSIALPLYLAHVRSELLPVVALVATASSTPSSSSRALAQELSLLRRTCDAVLEVENFACRREYPPPAEFRHLHGLLKVRKAATHAGGTATGAAAGHFADWTVAKRPAAFLYGLKRNRRSLAIPMLHIPPEDYAEGGGSVGAGGVRSGAGRPKEKSSLGCSSSGGAGASSLDF